MRFDLHIHTRDGSPDGRSSLLSEAARLRALGFDGMMVTDHNSFDGYDTDVNAVHAALPGFILLRGIEYDTRDAGHMLVVLPDGVTHAMLTLRGMKCDRLIELVHSLGGIVGPAHPYGTGFFALMHTNWIKGKRDVLAPFDFVETFNACCVPQANKRAAQLAAHFGKPCFGGSDAHKASVAGCGWTDTDRPIHCCDDLIAAVKEGAHFTVGGHFPTVGYRLHGRAVKWLGIVSYWAYNQGGALWRAHARHKVHK